MIFYCKVLILSEILWLTAKISAIKTDDWPPQIIIDTYGHTLPEVLKCQEENNVDIGTIEEFETTTDLNNLPNDQSLKCFMLCTFITFGFVVPGNPKPQVLELLTVISKMEYDERSAYLKMTSGCVKFKSKDMCEAVYQINVCMKKNYNERYYLVSGSDYWFNRKHQNNSHNAESSVTEETSLS